MIHTQTTYTNRIALRAGKKGVRPAEVGALASVFEKSATELKQQKLLKCKKTIQVDGRAKAGRPARTYIQQLFEDTGCSPEDLPVVMNDREKRGLGVSVRVA